MNDDINKYKLGRTGLAYTWIPTGISTLLDAGCAKGESSVLFLRKSKEVFGIDIDEKRIEMARQNCPTGKFTCGSIENMVFDNDFFDAIVMNEVLEHVNDEIRSLNEAFRTLKKGGVLIISVPHSGLFSFLDPANFKFILKKYCPAILHIYYKKQIEDRGFSYIFREGVHRHYTLNYLLVLVNSSQWKSNYRIERVFRSGLVLGVLNNGARALLGRVIGVRWAGRLLRPFSFLVTREYWIPFGLLSYNMAVSLKKL